MQITITAAQYIFLKYACLIVGSARVSHCVRKRV